MMIMMANINPDITPPIIPALSTSGFLFSPAPVADSTLSVINDNNVCYNNR